MGLINDLLGLFGARIERVPTHYPPRAHNHGPNHRRQVCAARVSSTKRELYFQKGFAPPRQTYPDKQFSDFLPDGSSAPPRGADHPQQRRSGLPAVLSRDARTLQ